MQVYSVRVIGQPHPCAIVNAEDLAHVAELLDQMGFDPNMCEFAGLGAGAMSWTFREPAPGEDALAEPYDVQVSSHWLDAIHYDPTAEAGVSAARSQPLNYQPLSEHAATLANWDPLLECQDDRVARETRAFAGVSDPCLTDRSRPAGAKVQ